MKVTHVDDHVTHAVISGAQAIDFGISDSPEFFNILSSTLYSDQILAVVRETLCNAWDAHIEFKCEGVPVQLTLDDKHLTIRDFGPGIAPAMIGPIYGVYGGSTKASNGKVTGGFGLGCKAPFAYVDDFEVTSYHEGHMTIYRMSKSNAEVGGKPSIVPVVSGIPSKEHGLQVKIAIKNQKDRRRYDRLIRRIVQNGAMNMTLNDELLPSLPFDDMVHGFMLTKKQVLENAASIVVRYGNVIYPIEKEESYGYEWDQIIEFLNRLGNSRYHRDHEWTLVLQAAPNTVSVTPSRESLSNQKHTLATIKELMLSFLGTKDKELTTECFRLLEERIDQTWMESNPAELFETSQAIPNLYAVKRMSSGKPYESRQGEFKFHTEENLTTFPQFVRQYAHTGYPDFPGFRKRDMLLRINALLVSGFGGQKFRKMLKAYRRAFLQKDKLKPKYRMAKDRWGDARRTPVPSSWFQQHIVWPIIKGMNEGNGLKADKLFAYAEPHSGYSHKRELVFQATKYVPQDIEEAFPFARNIVILSFNKMDVVEDTADDMGICKYWLGKSKNSLFYVVPRADAKVEAARAYFRELGVHLIDLTVDQQASYIQKQKDQRDYGTAPVVRKPKKNGIPKLSAMINESGNWQNDLPNLKPDITRITKPEWIIKDGRRNTQYSFEDFGVDVTKHIVALWGKQGGLCVNQNQYDRYQSAGAIDFKDYILDKLVEEYQTNPAIREYLEFDYKRIEISRYGKNSQWYGLTEWVKLIHKDKDLWEYFGLVDNRSKEDKQIMAIYRAFALKYYHGNTPKLKEFLDIIQSLKLKPAVQELYEKLHKSKLLRMMDVEGANTTINNPALYGISEGQQILARETLLTIIEG